MTRERLQDNSRSRQTRRDMGFPRSFRRIFGCPTRPLSGLDQISIATKYQSEKPPPPRPYELTV